MFGFIPSIATSIIPVVTGIMGYLAGDRSDRKLVQNNYNNFYQAELIAYKKKMELKIQEMHCWMETMMQNHTEQMNQLIASYNLIFYVLAVINITLLTALIIFVVRMKRLPSTNHYYITFEKKEGNKKILERIARESAIRSIQNRQFLPLILE